MPVHDFLFTAAPDFAGWSTDPARPDYASPEYRDQTIRWQVVHDARGGTPEFRRKAATYLPKFEAETLQDWTARVMQTFANDHYDTTLVEHVGLVFAQPLKLGDDVPEAIKTLCEDIDGEGNHLDVFAQSTFDAALHLGHCVLYTDYPDASEIKDKRDERRAKARPYVTLYRAADVLSWRTAVVGGVLVIVQIVFRETNSVASGEFGVESKVTYREVKQEVFIDEFSGRATGLGAITWRTFTKAEGPASSGSDAPQSPDRFTLTGSGVIVGPDHIPVRVVYGGEKLGLLHSKPHLFGLALSNIEETQVASDYAAVMHKCNVPTPVFIGRNTSSEGATIQMGQGIDIPQGGDAKFMEPTGVALAATRTRLEDIRTQMRRQGATSGDESGKVMTATEAAIYAKQRNAKLSRAARSLQDALEGVLADFAAFMRITPAATAAVATVRSGGSIAINTNFAGQQIDPALLTVYVSAYTAGALPLDALLFALEKGQLPDDFSAQDSALRLIAESAAGVDQITADADAATRRAAPALTQGVAA